MAASSLKGGLQSNRFVLSEMAAHLGSHQEPMRRWHRYSQSGAVPLTVNGVFFFFLNKM